MMKIERWFNVLVMGGAALGAQACEDDAGSENSAGNQASTSSASTSANTTGGMQGQGGATMGQGGASMGQGGASMSQGGASMGQGGAGQGGGMQGQGGSALNCSSPADPGDACGCPCCWMDGCLNNEPCCQGFCSLGNNGAGCCGD